ncbi:peptide chain release factor N(5)-glutamine methyltransferase [Methyloradius palustris]|uniref:Release factor glutamine methyltransferase n=1 Tax=Methyloradius palustris TaxID=2778876 RepID=A0A8D5G1E2_9PROT|nr:peptide chain release factor N(5)-glutamine methyltransferase [Methyloradius palustris]BCM26087.1 release factor glutamine methyltransferase [Methyloradius palustris]
MQPTLRQAVLQAQQQLVSTLQIEPSTARIEAIALLNHVMHQSSRAWFLAHENDALQANNHAEFQALLTRRLGGEPIAYILGMREFYGLKLKVTPDTLIPRPDTETLVETALAKIPKHQPYKILDLGTGTGAITLAIASQRPKTSVTAVDASEAALSVAIENAATLNIKNVSFLLSNWFADLQNQRFDLIVSNPPYIESNDAHLGQGDLRFEPLSALESGADGLDDIRSIIQAASEHLNPNGWLMLEHGYNQASEVAHLLHQAGFCDVSHAYDIAGIARVSIGMSTS